MEFTARVVPMKQSYIRILHQPKLKNPILIVGLPEIGNIGRIVARLLVELSHAKVFAELFSPSFPDYVTIDKKGVCRPPRYAFYTSKTGQSLIILTGDGQPSPEDVSAHYEICDDILDFAGKLECSLIITIGGALSPHPTKEVYVAATSRKLAKNYVEKGVSIYNGGRIIGISGLLLGLAEKRGLKGVCLLAPTLGISSDREAAYNIFKFLRKVLGIDIQEGRKPS